MNCLERAIILCLLFGIAFSDSDLNDAVALDSYEIEGKVFPPDNLPPNTNWQANTFVTVKGGYHLGFLREDGTFVISNVPSGSYVVEVVNPNYTFEAVRVEINSKGKYRARKVNYIQTSQVIQVPYPLKMKPLGQVHYFQVREQWRLIDFIFNPMVLMMVLPLLLIMVVPRIMNDPETRKEMEQLNSLTKYDMPEMSEVITSFFGGSDKQKPKSIKASKKSSKATS
uniref:ER membrane protein complex subunit 7 beta-sandwich domain-containing protein n=1 Tax=Clastoptera arizonana TaxID=38151 RepID=A0A1B6EB66_9HEMI